MKRVNKLVALGLTLSMLMPIALTGCSDPGEDSAASPSASDSGYVQQTGSGAIKVGEEAPDFEVELINGDKVKLSDYRGQVVLINFWATWCGYCVKEMPDLQELTAEYGDKLVVLAVNASEDMETIENFAQKFEYSFVFARDGSFEASYAYPTDGIPYTVVVDPEGTITGIHTGMGQYSLFDGFIKSAMS